MFKKLPKYLFKYRFTIKFLEETKINFTLHFKNYVPVKNVLYRIKAQLKLLMNPPRYFLFVPLSTES